MSPVETLLLYSPESPLKTPFSSNVYILCGQIWDVGGRRCRGVAGAVAGALC